MLSADLMAHISERISTADQVVGKLEDEHVRKNCDIVNIQVVTNDFNAYDHILDIHSTSQDVVPFWVYPHFARNAAVASALPLPTVHLVMPKGLGSGCPVIQHGRHGQADSDAGAALVVECGQHFLQASADRAVRVARAFLAHFGLMASEPRI